MANAVTPAWSVDLCQDWRRVAVATAFTFNARDPADVAELGEWVMTFSRQGASWGTYVSAGKRVSYGPADVDTVRLVEKGSLRFAGIVAPAAQSGNGGIERATTAGRETVTLSGPGLGDVLARRLAFPEPDKEAGWLVSHDVRSGVASSVLASYIDANAGPGAIPSRQIPGLVIADDVVGTTGDWSARFQPLHELASRICYDGDLVCRMSADFDGGITAHITAPRNLSERWFLSDKGDLRTIISRNIPASATWVLAGGQGEGTSRVFRSSTSSAAGSDRRENFSDQSSLTTVSELQSAAHVARVLGGPSWSVNAEMTDGSAGFIPFGRDVLPGDLIGLEIDGRRHTVPVTALLYDISTARAVVRPVLGTAEPDAFRGLRRDVAGISARFATTVA